MQQGDLFWSLEKLSDASLLGSLNELVGSSRRVLATVLAHLGEVEERRLHLAAGYGSLFVYCVSHLSMSESEAYRRVEVSRLARRFPALFPLLADGSISLSVAALLKPHLSTSNVEEITRLVCGASVQRARELLASRFPRPDVPATIRKLPEPRLSHQQIENRPGTLPGFGDMPSRTQDNGPEASAQNATNAAARSSMGARAQPIRGPMPPAPVPSANLDSLAPARTLHTIARHAPASHCAIDPIAKNRYKVQFTADADLKNKLELARDLLRHALPSGDLPSILARALDLLIERHMKRRFGVGAKCRPGKRVDTQPTGAEQSMTQRMQKEEPATAAPPSPPAGDPTEAAPTRGLNSSPALSRATRRAVFERDGLRCSFCSDAGVQCEARAWLEDDHIQPRARGGDNDPTNIRLLCRAHNQWAAERTYGRAHIENAIRRRGKRTRDANGELRSNE